MEFHSGGALIHSMAKRTPNPATIARQRQADHRQRHFVREWRKFRGLTQERLAERTPFTTGAISQLETGRTKYTQDMIEALAVALDCSPGDLLSKDPLKEGEIIDLMRHLPESKKGDVIAILKALTA
jgi:transcriptional regulator with XRE-family HTH domain